MKIEHDQFCYIWWWRIQKRKTIFLKKMGCICLVVTEKKIQTPTPPPQCILMEDSWSTTWHAADIFPIFLIRGSKMKLLLMGLKHILHEYDTSYLFWWLVGTLLTLNNARLGEQKKKQKAVSSMVIKCKNINGLLK